MKNSQKTCYQGCDSTYKNADIVLFGAPFDATTSFRPGTRFASKAMRQDACGLETYSPYQDADLCDLRVHDGGDLDLPFGNVPRALKQIEAAAGKILRDGKIPVMLGGEHLVTLGAVRAALKQYPALHVVHFDAHADLRDNYLGESLSHATVMRRIWELTGNSRIFQYGIRSGERQEFAFAQAHTNMQRFTADTTQLKALLPPGAHVYVTIDLDVLDTSVFPGTGTPEPGGLRFQELLNGLLPLKGLPIIGCDVVELSPPYDQSGISTAAACKVLRELLLLLKGE